MRIWLVCFLLGAFLPSCSNKNSVRDESGVEVKGLDEAEKNSYVVFGKKYFPISRFQLLRRLVLPLGMVKIPRKTYLNRKYTT